MLVDHTACCDSLTWQVILPAIIYVAMTRLIIGVKEAESSSISNYMYLHLYMSDLFTGR